LEEIGVKEDCMRLSVGKVSKMFGISRTTLLYYDKIGLLSPTERSASGYRLYSQSDITRLKQIFILKNAGMPLNQISNLIANEEQVVFGKLMKRLGEFNLEIEKLKNQQNQIINILDKMFISKNIRNEDLNTIRKIISYAEIDFDKRELWHAEFEKQSPEQHEYFLAMLGLNDDEIKALKKGISKKTILQSGN